jgi:HEAT repeat protein
MGLLLPAESAPPANLAEDPARLREMLSDIKDPLNQGQAALLLVQGRGQEFTDVIRQGLRQTDSAEVFVALASALRQNHDGRFNDELINAVISGRAAVRHAAAETLAIVVDADALVRLRAIADDARAELSARQEALWTLGRTGRKAAAVVLLEQLASPEENIRRAAADALADLSGQNLGPDPARWRIWWQTRKDQSNEQWLEDRLAYQTSRSRRLEAELDRAKVQMLQLHQQLYAHMPPPDRLSHILNLADRDDPAVRLLAVKWGMELLAQPDPVSQRALSDLMLRLSHDGTQIVQQAAVLGLGRVGDARAYDQLRHLLKHGQPTVRAAAAHALTQQAKIRATEMIVPAGGPSRNPEETGSEAMREVVPLLQKALDDPALEVVVAAAEDLGALGLPEAGPVLASLLKHPSEPVRQTAAQALERVSDPKILDGLMAALEDPSVPVRFGLIGALGHIAADPQGLKESERGQMLIRLEEMALRDTDAGVRSRAATVLGQCGGAAELAFLWRRVISREDSRVQEKSWAAMLDIFVRIGNPDLVTQWANTLAEANQPARRVQLLVEVSDRWKKTEALRTQALTVTDLLARAHLEQGKWAPAFPLIRELLDHAGTDAELERLLRELLMVGERALGDGNHSEATRACREAQPYLARSPSLAPDFEKLERRARP